LQSVLFATIILGLIAVYQGMAIIDVFFFAVALAVSAIPEGLPVALTVVLSIAAHRMAGRHVIVRKMTAVESLGSCTHIASDKTGTLTMNEQTAHIVLLTGVFNRLMISQILVSSIIMGLIGFVTWYYMISIGVEENTARNLAVLLFVLLENVHIFNCRSEYVSAFRMPLSRNLFLVGSVIAAQFIYPAAMHIPVLQDVLGLEPISLSEWGILLAAAFIIIIIMEIFKLIWPRIEKTDPFLKISVTIQYLLYPGPDILASEYSHDWTWSCHYPRKLPGICPCSL